MRDVRPRHVLLTTDAVGGVWTYALDLARGLLARHTRVTLAVLGPLPAPRQRVAADGVLGLAVIETGLPLDWLETDPEQLRGAARALARMANAIGADLVHLNSPALAGEARFAQPVVGGCHACLASWWDAVRGGKMPASFRWRTELLARGYRACDRLIAPSHAFSRTTAGIYGVTPEVVHSGRARPAADGTGPRERAALTSGRLWDDAKNLATLDGAAARMHGRVLAAGPLEGPHGQVRRLDHIDALGSLGAAALERRLAGVAVFVSLSRYEPFGLGVLEAAQGGCALVLSDIPTFRELWEGAAVFVPPTDEGVVATTLDALLEDPGRCAGLGRAARERAGRYTIEAMVAGTLQVYHQALAIRTPRPEAA